jgi:hypothetical protein
VRLLERGDGLLPLEKAMLLAYHVNIAWPLFQQLDTSKVVVLAVWSSLPSMLALCDVLGPKLPILSNIPGLQFGSTVYDPLSIDLNAGVPSTVHSNVGYTSLEADEVPFPLSQAASLEGRATAWGIRMTAQEGMLDNLNLCDAPIITMTIRSVSDSTIVVPSC